MFGVAWSWNWREWRLGVADAIDEDANGREIVIGRWLCLGPLALTYEYE